MEHVKTLVLGGGITGQMVGLLHSGTTIVEAREEPKQKFTRQFGANYLWEPVPLFETIAFPVITHVDGKPGTADTIMRYKNKIGKPEDDGQWGLQFDTETVGYDIVSYPEVPVQWGVEIKTIDAIGHRATGVVNGTEYTVRYDRLISTIPLSELTKVLTWENDYPVVTMFKCMPIFVVVVARPPDAPYPEGTLYVNYLSNPLIECYRFCDRLSDRHYEGLTSMGRFPSKKLYPGKIKASPGVPQLLDNLAEYNITCFGRYGKWSPDELLHETYKDIVAWVETSAPNSKN